MHYLERTLQVKAALLEQPDLLNELRATFKAHLGLEGEREAFGEGNSRLVYDVGVCEVDSGDRISLLLKLKKDEDEMSFFHASREWKYNEWSEFGAFETYYDFVAGHLSELSFRTQAGYEQYRRSSILGKNVASTFSLNDSWGGTRVEQGDIGALPYFQLVVRFGEWFGQLTEGEPPVVAPKQTAQDYRTMDDNTVERGRIIDLGPTQTLLIDIDQGGSLISRGNDHANNLGIKARGEKYFAEANRLDL